jgi:hypothetical protein
MTSRTPNLCRACERFNVLHGACEAFPEGIPDDILIFGEDHSKPFAGDHGIRFQPGKSLEQVEALQAWQKTFGDQ